MPRYRHRLLFVILAAAAATTTTTTPQDETRVQTRTEKIEELVRQWAPTIWLAPDEKFFPSSIEDFLKNVYAGDDDGFPVDTGRDNDDDSLPEGKESETLFLHTKINIDQLKNGSSFLYGNDPSANSVPIYAIVSNCDLSKRTFLSFDRDNAISKDRSDEPDLYFHLTYWIFYPYNEGKEFCVIGNIPAPFIFNTCLGKSRLYGNHVGDFEHMSLSFKGNPYPDEMFLSVHDTGVYYKYDPNRKIFKYKKQVSKIGLMQGPKFPPIVRLSKRRPLLFAARGSHGLWSAPGDHQYVRVPRLIDVNGYGVPWKTWDNLKIYHLGYSQPPMWMKYEGKWGNPKSKCFFSRQLGFCELFDGPPGVLKRVQDFTCST